MELNELMMIGGAACVGLVILSTFVALLFRRVVPTNEVHIVQSSGATTSYGKDTKNANTYYEWPAWIPFFGVLKTVLPVSVFDLDLDGYEAYDKGRLPFVVDVKAFFRITDSNMAAQRVASFGELREQLIAIVQGSVRTILASHDLEEIMQGRSQFGEQFTKEVTEQLLNWGVQTVKNIELMDIRDSSSSQVIKNIMEKKKSHIEMESRIEVAKNKKDADVAEVEAKQVTEIRKREAEQMVGIRAAEAQREVQLANEAAYQQIKDQQRLTKEKEMAVLEVEKTRAAEIQKQVAVVTANQNKETQVILAEAEKQTTIVKAEGQLEAATRDAKGVEARGEAEAAAKRAMELAPVQAQIVLAKEIGENNSYQQYLVTIEKVKAARDVGMEQAKALGEADIKVIANSGSPTAGLTNVMDIFSSQGGTAVGAMLEGLSHTDTGKALLKKVGVDDVKATVKH